jgi:hypothetical protein
VAGSLVALWPDTFPLPLPLAPLPLLSRPLSQHRQEWWARRHMRLGELAAFPTQACVQGLTLLGPPEHRG